MRGTGFKVGENLWKNVPLAIRCAKQGRDRSGGGPTDLRIDERLEEMCQKAFVTGEMACRPYTLEEIGSYIGVSRERVRQIQEQAIRSARTIIREQFGWELDLNDLMPNEHNPSDPVP